MSKAAPLAKAQPQTPAATQQKVSLLATVASKYSIAPAQFYETVKKTCMPANATEEEFIAFICVANELNLNPLSREIYAFPKRGGGIQPIVSVDGWVKMVNRHPQFDGFECEPIFDKDSKLAAMIGRMYRKDTHHCIEVVEYLSECKRNTDPWTQMPSRMLRHKAYIQAARLAFGFANIMDDDEGETIKAVDGEVVASIPATSRTEALKKKLLPSQQPSAVEPHGSEAVAPSTLNDGNPKTQKTAAAAEPKPMREPGEDDGEDLNGGGEDLNFPTDLIPDDAPAANAIKGR